MQKTVYDAIANLENFIDGLIFVDMEGRVVYHKQFPGHILDFNEKDTVGKKLEEVFRDYDSVNSPLYRALKYGEFTINQVQLLKFYSGQDVLTVNTVYPVRRNNQIIGAVSASQVINSDGNKCQYIDLSPNLSAAVIEPMAIKHLFTTADIIGDSPGARRLKDEILKVSQTRSNVMIIGETGTGKELAAQSIHSHSKRNSKPFIVQNCAAIPHTLLESLFFGTMKGSFTGAADSPGIFEQANGGTIFLDEVNSMDITLQSKILRVLEDGIVTRLGGRNPIHVDVRIISATNQHPRVCLGKELLRRDLYYRLSVLQIELPTLADRIEDIRPIVRHYVNIYNKEMEKHVIDATDEVYQIFQQYDWPGNIRELRNVLETAFNFAESDYITAADLPDYVLHIEPREEDRPSASEHATRFSGHRNMPLRDAVDDFERNYILEHAEHVSSLVELADSLHISKQLLHHKIKKYDLKITF